MNEAKFTKGPWQVGFDDESGMGSDTEGAWIVSKAIPGRHETVVTGSDHDGFPTGVLRDADAHLIAAAPEMYDKGQFKRNVIIRDNPAFEGEWVAVPREDFDAFKAVLAKAGGERAG